MGYQRRHFSIGQVAARTGLSVDALRFYERTGLMREDVPRLGGRRVYTQDHIDWLTFRMLLRRAGMPLHTIRDYAHVVRRGDGTESERLDLLRRHQHHLAEQQRDLTRCTDIVNQKIATYEDLIARGLPASSCEGPRHRST